MSSGNDFGKLQFFFETEYNMATSEDGQPEGNITRLPAELKADSQTKPCDQHPSVKLKHTIEIFTIENITCCMNNGAQFMMAGWGTVLVAIETSTDSRMYVVALIFNLLTWAVTLTLIIMIIIRRRACAGKVLKLMKEEWPEETMEKTKMLQRFSFRLSMTLVVLHIISMIVTSVHISGILGSEPSNRCDLTMGSNTADGHFANITSDT